MGTKKTAKNKISKPAKSKTAAKKSTSRSKGSMNVYSNLAYRRRVKADQRARKQAEDLASLPKNPIARFFAKLHPKRVLRFWFSREGLIRIAKGIAALFLITVIGIGGLFLYFKKDLAQIDPEGLAARVADTVNTYLDRNGVVLWEDKGDGDYRLVVDGSEISTYMRQATVAIEDRNFYNHIGVDFQALIRAVLSNIQGNHIQGGSTLTQQLIKQVYFADEAHIRDAGGIPRKIKEIILAIEVEKMYDKEQIITMYLNESPYGGRRNGVESGARTYFGKAAKDLTLAESALLAAIPQNPAVFNPYNPAGHARLIQRQHWVLDAMYEMNYISAERRDEAKAFDILETIRPEASQYANIKAPWFVLEVKSRLEAKYGIRTMRAGGFTITTTLDYRAQEIAERSIAIGAEHMHVNGTDNASLVSIDVETSQVIAMVGSVDWNRPGFGQVNATTSLLEPASSIKPFFYASLFTEREGQNWGPGSILVDEDINALYCRGFTGRCSIRNASNRTYGAVTLRQSLAGSLNRPVVKALFIDTIPKGLRTVHELGNVSYCAHGENAGLSMAIGGGCAVRPVEHANSYASLARGGSFKDIVYWLEVRNSSGDIIDVWEDVEGKQVVDPQIAFMVNDMLHDIESRRFVFGSLATSQGFFVPGVWTAIKTGTSDNGRGRAKDSWFASYSPVLSTVVWNGNHNGAPMTRSSYAVTQRVIHHFMDRVHKEVLGPDGEWYAGQTIPRPAGLQTLTVDGRTDIWPSWYNESRSGTTREEMTFDSVTRKLATRCTPQETRVQVTVSRIIDPMTRREILVAPDGFDPNEEDDLHQCNDVKPQLNPISISGSGPWTIEAVISNTATTHALSRYTIVIDGVTVSTGTAVRGRTISYETTDNFTSVTITISDVAGYTASRTQRK
jgi:penicillin-binding protein 1A